MTYRPPPKPSQRALDAAHTDLLLDALHRAIAECDTHRLTRVPLPRPLAIELLELLRTHRPRSAA